MGKGTDASSLTWEGARGHCINNAVGGRKGWRLPSVNELASLIDPSVVTLPPLPSGHPFTGIQTNPEDGPYWSMTTDASAPQLAWVVFFGPGGGLGGIFKTSPFPFAWCVRSSAVLESY